MAEAGGGGGAPSECLAEFLSALMRREYRPALRYCRLILQYEPNNATAQGFYPLLRHKVKLAAAAKRTAIDTDESPMESSEDEESASERTSGGDSDDCGSSSISWRRDTTASEASTASGSGGGRRSSDGGSPAATGALLLDDNGNALGPGDAENDNATSSAQTPLGAALAPLRAQFAPPPRRAR